MLTRAANICFDSPCGWNGNELKSCVPMLLQLANGTVVDLFFYILTPYYPIWVTQMVFSIQWFGWHTFNLIYYHSLLAGCDPVETLLSQHGGSPRQLCRALKWNIGVLQFIHHESFKHLMINGWSWRAPRGTLMLFNQRKKRCYTNSTILPKGWEGRYEWQLNIFS